MIPAGLRRPRRPAGRRVVQDRDVVEAAIHRASLEPHDVRNRYALIGRRAGDRRGRWGRGGVVRLERVRERVHVHVRVRGRCVALRVGRRRESGDRPAEPRLDLRPGKDRSAARVVGDSEVNRRPQPHRRHQVVVTDGKPRDEALVVSVGAHRERRRDVFAVEAHVDGARIRSSRQDDLHERIPTRDEVGAVGKNDDLRQSPVSGRGRRARNGEETECCCRQKDDAKCRATRLAVHCCLPLSTA